MKRGLLNLSLICLLSVIAVDQAHSEDLLAVYDQAVVNDPQIREADALRMASREARPQAIAALLPALAATASKGRSWGDGSSSSLQTIGNQTIPTSNGQTSVSDSKGWNINLRQSVFSWANWSNLRAAGHEVAQAESDYVVAKQSLAQRVSQQYFAVLSAQDDVEALEAARDAIARQLEQAERRFEVGLIAITDVQEARAERDQAAARVIASKRALASAHEQLRATIGVKPAVLNKPADNMPLLAPTPANEEDWVKASMEQNASLISSRLAADIARDQVSSTFGAHLPTLDLVAGRGHNESDGPQTVFPSIGAPISAVNAANNDNKSVTLQLSVPLFSGGATQSRVRQSQYGWIAAKERLERTSRSTERLARDAFLGVNSEISRVQALRQALESSQTALRATEAGYEVGTRTAVDVLNARQRLVQAQTAYSQSRYSYINNLIQLRLASGDLDRSTLQEINQWLTVETRPAAPVAPPTPAQ
jgi:outer membrane protein